MVTILFIKGLFGLLFSILSGCGVFAVAHDIKQLVFGLKESAGIAEAESEELVDDGAIFFGLHFAPHIIMIGEEGIVALMKENEVLEETFLEKSVVRIEVVDHLHTLIGNSTILKSQFLKKMHQSLGKAQIVIPQRTDFFADRGQLRGINVRLIAIVVNHCFESRECLLSEFGPLSQFEVGRLALIGFFDLSGDSLLCLCEGKRVKMGQDDILVIVFDL